MTNQEILDANKLCAKYIGIEIRIIDEYAIMYLAGIDYHINILELKLTEHDLNKDNLQEIEDYGLFHACNPILGSSKLHFHNNLNMLWLVLEKIAKESNNSIGCLICTLGYIDSKDDLFKVIVNYIKPKQNESIK